MEQMEDQSLSNPANRPLVTFDNNVVIDIRNNGPSVLPARQLLALNCAGVITINVTVSTAFEKQRPDDQLEMHEYRAWFEARGIARNNIFTHPLTVGFNMPGDNIPTFHPLSELVFNKHIHQILFPDIPFRRNDYRDWLKYLDQKCVIHGIVGTKREALIELDKARNDIYIPFTPRVPARRPTPALDALEQAEREKLQVVLNKIYDRWRGKKNDALGLYNHLTQAAYTTHPEYAVFVTNDGNFRKPIKLAELRKWGFRGEILPPAEAVAFILTVTGTSLPQGEAPDLFSC
jgi:hypothetical protein